MAEHWNWPKEPRHLKITDLERIERFRRAGYGGSVSDSLHSLSVNDTVFSSEFKALRQGMQLVGRALPIKLHSIPPDELEQRVAQWEKEGKTHPQKLMMRAVTESAPGSILCFDCGGDTQPAQFGEMSCQLAYSHGCRGMLIAGNCRDTQYVLKMPDFPMFTFGTRPNAFGGWVITDVDRPIFLPGHLTHYVKVTPGDFIFGDNDGVQLIPKDLVDEVLLRVEDIFATENEERELLAAGMPIDQVYKQFGVL
jgi:4-hydroxy-4-methyl-2-oxoglutarate aldolase